VPAESRSAATLPERARPVVEAGVRELLELGLPDALWRRDATPWRGVAERDIADWVGWVPVVDEMRRGAGELGEWAAATRADLSHATLLGMGGSSLGPEVLRQTLALPSLTVLDTTHPSAVRRAERDDSLFVVASKSGGTIETRSHEACFLRRANEDASRFVAVTDPGTGLDRDASERGYRHVFRNRADIGGRYSVLSYFGMVPAALAGADVGRLLDSAAAMVEACRRADAENPGLALGGALGALAREGRDKVTIVADEPYGSFGLWAEQLLAESTGKNGVGLVPVAGEPLGDPDVYGDDRVFVHLRAAGGGADGALAALADAGHPVLVLELADPHDLGGEFFRWEVATAAAGALLRINPFDQPNVQEAKDLTARVLADWERDRALPPADAESVEDVLRAAEPGSYVAILAYVDPGGADEAAFTRVRAALRDRFRVATTFGYGPRYLHSTGQLHKGGPPTGCFLQVVDRDVEDLAIPGRQFGFATLMEAQALGDLQALRGRGRPVARVPVERFEESVTTAMTAIGG
jgi:glucose-6-phosphate isomerase